MKRATDEDGVGDRYGDDDGDAKDDLRLSHTKTFNTKRVPKKKKTI